MFHNPQTCPAKKYFRCKQRCYTSRKCRNRRSVTAVDENSEAEEEEPEEMEEYMVVVLINGVSIQMEVDTGACRTVMHNNDFMRYFKDYKIENLSFCSSQCQVRNYKWSVVLK